TGAGAGGAGVRTGSVSWTVAGIAASRHTVATAPVATNWTSTGTWACAHAAPTRDPTTAPTENAAWNWGRIVRPTRRSMPALSTFMGTLPRANAIPLTKMPAARSATDPVAGPRPSSRNATPNSSADTVNATR